MNLNKIILIIISIYIVIVFIYIFALKYKVEELESKTQFMLISIKKLVKKVDELENAKVDESNDA